MTRDAGRGARLLPTTFVSLPFVCFRYAHHAGSGDSTLFFTPRHTHTQVRSRTTHTTRSRRTTGCLESEEQRRWRHGEALRREVWGFLPTRITTSQHWRTPHLCLTSSLPTQYDAELTKKFLQVFPYDLMALKTIINRIDPLRRMEFSQSQA